ncbi:MAG: hypothetical protein NW201_15225 [Gemmatimonadales bacterium]|nr:hypothetical protein [Gemmatimonadales bacterium]
MPLSPPPIPAPVVRLARTLEEAGHEAWCVGGALRDHLLGDPQADHDLATSATPDEVQRLFRRTVPVGVRFGTVGVLDAEGRLHEVTTFRRDVQTDGRHAVVEYGASLEDDLARRDFTINALAFHPLRGEWRDPFGGEADLAARLLRAVGDPAERFREDFLRILRGLRFAARFGLRIDEATWHAMRAEAPGLAGLSAERVRDEWLKGLRTARAVTDLVERWHASGAAAVVLPGLHPVGTLPEPPADWPRDAVLLTSLLVDDAPAVLRRLRASNAEVARAEALARGPAEPADASPSAVRRWMAGVLDAADDLVAAATLRAGSAPAWAAVVAAVRARGEPTRRGDLALRGDDLRAAGVPPGPALGRTLDALLARVLDDPALNTREALLALVQAGVA